MLSVDAILFDLDGTLIDSQKDLARAVHHIQKKYGRSPSSEKSIAGFIGDGVVKLVERATGLRAGHGLEDAVDVFKLYYRHHALDHTRLYPGVLAVLKYFRAKKMAVVTNKPVRVSKRILRGLKVSRYFAVVVGGDSLSKKKPSPEPLLHALKLLCVRSKRRVLMVGDGYQDILAGRAAGILTCGIPSTIGDEKKLRESGADFTVPSLRDLIRIIE